MDIEKIENSKKRTAIVLDGNQKSALAIVRSLGAAGIQVAVGAERSSGMALHSRFARQRFVYLSPKQSQKKFIDSIYQVAKDLGEQPLIYACSDATALTLFKFREALAPVATLAFPSESAVDLAFDKAATYSKAGQLGIKTIPTFMPSSQNELPKFFSNISYPAVIKTRHSVTWNNGEGVFGTAYFVHSQAELEQKFSELLIKTGEAPLIQTFIKGEEYGVDLLVREGAVSGETIHHRLRSLSPTGGASVVKETIEEGELTRSLREAAYQLAASLSWTGPLMVEFKVENDSQTVYLMEQNGRWWGSLPLSIKAGVDFPVMFFEQVKAGYRETEVITGRPYVVSRHFLGDVVNLARVWFGRDKMRPYLYPERRKALRDFFQTIPNTHSDVWLWSDPLPSFMEYIDMVAKLIRK